MTIQIDMGAGKPCVGLVIDGHGVVLMAPPMLGYMLEWQLSSVLAYAEYRGWRVIEIVADESNLPLPLKS